MIWHWGAPQRFWWIAALIFLMLIALRVVRRRQRKLAQALGPKGTPYLIANLSSSKKWFKFFLEILALGFLVVAWARPQILSGETKVHHLGTEVVLLLDVSNSMLAEDMPPSRLEYLKIEMAKLIDRLGGHRVGLIAFAGSALVLSPLTHDLAAVRMYIESLSPSAVMNQGTDFRRALEEAFGLFTRGGLDSAQPGDQVTRVLVIASDGEDMEAGALLSIQKAKELNLAVFTLAIGTEEGAPIPVANAQGMGQSFKKDSGGKVVQTKVNPKFLRDLAGAAGGTALVASFAGGEANEIADAIGQLKQTALESEIATAREERFQVPLLLATILAIICFGLGFRRKAPRLWRGRFELGAS